MRNRDPEKHSMKKEALLMVAMECFSARGFQGTSISHICARAKISPGHLYHYFASKEEILGDIINLVLEHAVATFTAALDTSDVISAIKAYTQAIFQRSLDGGYPLYFDLFAEASRNQQVAALLDKQSKGMHDLLSAALEKGQQTGEINPALNIPVAAAAMLSLIDASKMIHMRNHAQDGSAIVDALHQMVIGYLK
ncbi:TetR/AcrR family transcriptional regulator [Shimwellia pseudoproteus]|uniref:TetR/AcrR family transcriptional regulator n=1 Tax=Shimwellia pseudoproteus TaxID=570012 RepID=UPI0018ED7F29|nr:TetR/AcrR family transcriptional regulator [Shimwellia pseudoproteus]